MANSRRYISKSRYEFMGYDIPMDTDHLSDSPTGAYLALELLATKFPESAAEIQDAINVLRQFEHAVRNRLNKEGLCLALAERRLELMEERVQELRDTLRLVESTSGFGELYDPNKEYSQARLGSMIIS